MLVNSLRCDNFHPTSAGKPNKEQNCIDEFDECRLKKRISLSLLKVEYNFIRSCKSSYSNINLIVTYLIEAPFVKEKKSVRFDP